MTLLAHKIELRPTEAQKAYFLRAMGSRRHCYNNLLSHFVNSENKWSKKEAYRHYMDVLRTNHEWYSDFSSRVTRNAIDDLDSAFQGFFRRLKTGKKPGFPSLKKRGVRDSFSLREKELFKVNGRSIKLARLDTPVAMVQRLRFAGTPKQVTISQRAGKFFASILVETNEYKVPSQEGGSVGVDFGVKELAVTSDGVVFPASQPLKASLQTLARRQRRLSKKCKGSNRYAKAKLSVGKLHLKVANQRQAVLHRLSDYLTKTYKTICLEDLNVSGMVKNHKLARAIHDAGFSMLRAQIEYKAALRGAKVVFIGRFSPSSKTCSACGAKHDMPLSKREMVCPCGLTMDRDLNAAKNILSFGLGLSAPDLKRTKESRKAKTRVAGNGSGVDSVKSSKYLRSRVAA